MRTSAAQALGVFTPIGAKSVKALPDGKKVFHIFLL